MSAEIAEPPAAAPISPFSILDSLVVPGKEERTGQPSSAQQPAEKQDAPVRQEPVKTTAPTLAPMSPKAHENFKKIEKEKLEALERAKTVEAQHEETKKLISERETRIRDLEATLAQRAADSGNVTGLQLTVDEQAQTIKALQQELKAADVKRDPEFVDRYVNGKKFQEDMLADVGSLVGAQKEHVHQALRMGDEAKLAEIRDALPPAQQRRWDAALLKREQIDQERELAERNADKTWEQLQKQRQESFSAQQARVATENRKLARTVQQTILEQTPALKENALINGMMQEIAEGLSGGKGSEHWPKAKIIEAVMMSRVYETALAGMDQRSKDLEAKLKTESEERKKLEGYLKSRGIPYSDTAGFQDSPTNGKAPVRSLLDSIQINKGR